MSYNSPELPRMAWGQGANMGDEEPLTVEEAAKEVKLSTHTIRRGYMGGHLKVQRLGSSGRVVRIIRRDLHAWRDAGANTTMPEGHYR